MKTDRRHLRLGPFEVPLRSWKPIERAAHALIVRGGRHIRHLGGRLEGLGYELAGRRPDPTVSDDVLADRVRSAIGTLEKRLDVPRVHVMVNDHVATLHGSVGALHDAVKIEEAVADVSGVVGVESYLHIGFGPGSTRPSEGRRHHADSDGMKSLCAAVRESGAPEASARRVLRAVLSTLGDRLPEREWDQVVLHLPDDVKHLAAPPRRTPMRRSALRTQESFARAVASAAGCTLERAVDHTTAVMHTLKDLVPEETADVAASLPQELRTLWTSA